MAVFRIDVASLQTPRLDADGVLHVEAYATRTGVFEYRDPSGTVRREYRPAEHVFAPEAMSTLSGIPVTIGHPGLVTPQNVRQVRVGVVEGLPRQDEARMAIQLRLDEPATIDKVMRGELTELSLGYRCDVRAAAGVTDLGERYDMIQENHKANHVALLPAGAGRAGRECAIRLDADDAAETAVGAVTEAVEAVEAAVEAVDAEPTRDQLMTMVEELKAKIEELEARLSESSERMDSLKRAQLERDVSSVLPGFKCDGKSDADLQKAVVTKMLPAVRMDGVDLGSLFVAALSVATQAAKKPAVGVAQPVVKQDAAKTAREEMLAAHKAACKI